MIHEFRDKNTFFTPIKEDKEKEKRFCTQVTRLDEDLGTVENYVLKIRKKNQLINELRMKGKKAEVSLLKQEVKKHLHDMTRLMAKLSAAVLKAEQRFDQKGFM